MPERSFCPYVGLRPYDEEDRPYFFGRDREVRSVADSLFASRVTIFYGASGVGKSSVLMAGVVPELRAEPRTAIVVFRSWQVPDAAAQLKRDIAAAAAEVCGRGLGALESLPLDDMLKRTAEEIDGTVLLILDQFEEFFLYFKDPESGFDAELARAITRRDVDAGFVISLREDSLSKLDRLKKRVPQLLANMLRLSHLRVGAAKRAIIEPLAVYNERRPEAAKAENKVEIEPELVQTVLEQTAPGQLSLARAEAASREAEIEEGRVEAPFLQLVLERLWYEEIPSGSRKLRLATLERLGGAGKIVRTHLNEVLNQLVPSDQELCSRVFDRLVTPSGAKIAVKRGDLAAYAGDLAAEVPRLISFLERNRILARIAAPAGASEDDDQYQIFHDVLAPGFIDWRERFLREKDKAAADAEAAERARSAIEEERRRADEQRRKAEEATRARELVLAEERASQESRLRKRFQVAALVAFAMALVASYFLNRAIVEGDMANDERRRAEESAKEARAAAEAERKAKSESQRAQAILLVEKIRETYARTSDPEAALAALKQVIEGLDATSPAAYALRGRIRLDQAQLMRAGNRTGEPSVTKAAAEMIDLAIADLDKSLDLDFRQPAVFVTRAEAKLARDDLPAAIADYDRAIGMAPEDAQLVFDRGSLRARQKDLDGAVADYSKAIELAPTFAAAYLARAELLRLAGRNAQARDDLERAERYARDDSTRLTAQQRLQAMGHSAARRQATQTVFLHITGSDPADRDAAEAAKRALEREFRVAGIQSVMGARTNGDVRYVRTADQDQTARDERAASAVARVVEGTLAASGFSVKLQPLALDSKRFPDAKPGTIEVWLPPLRSAVPQLQILRGDKY